MTNVQPHVALLHTMTGCWVSQALYIAAKLGIADLLHERPQSSAMLAETTQTNAGALYRVLRALASVGIFAEDEDGCFSLTPMAEPLGIDQKQREAQFGKLRIKPVSEVDRRLS